MIKFKEFLKILDESFIQSTHYKIVKDLYGEDAYIQSESSKMIQIKILTNTREADFVALGNKFSELNIEFQEPKVSSIKFGYEIPGDITVRYFFKPFTGANNSIRAEDYEAIVCTVQNLRFTDNNLEKAYTLSLGEKNKMESIINIADAYKDDLLKSLKSVGINTTLQINGRVKEPTTKEWSQLVKEGGNTKVDSTPKTDIIGPSGTNRISVKKGTSQLISSSVGETYAIFQTAVNETNANQLILDEIKKNMTKFKYKKTITEIKKINAEERNDMEAEIFNSIINNKKFKDEIVKLLENDPDLKKSIVREAMTGEKKFGLNSSSTAEYLMVLNDIGNEIKKFSVIDDALVNSYAKDIKIVVAFKSSGQNKWSVLRLISESFDEVNNEMEDLINEGLIDWAKDKIKSVKEFLKLIFARFIKKLQEIKHHLFQLLNLDVKIDGKY